MLMSRIMIGIPCYGDPAAEVYEDHMRMMYYFGRRYPEHTFFLGLKTKSEQFRARNNIIDAAVGMRCQYTLMIDDDMVFDVSDTYNIDCGQIDAYEFLNKMLAHQKGIVGALYVTRGGLYEPVCLKKYKGSYAKYRWDEIQPGLMPVDSVGGGIMLIDNGMFGKHGIKLPVFEPELQWGTDIQLCRKAQAIGVQPYVDTDIHVGHLSRSRQIITTKNCRDFQEEKLMSRSREFEATVKGTITEEELKEFDRLGGGALDG